MSLLKSIHKINPYADTKHPTQIFDELVLSLLKEHIMLGHAGIVDHSNLSITLYQIKENIKKEMDRNNNIKK